MIDEVSKNYERIGQKANKLLIQWIRTLKRRKEIHFLEGRKIRKERVRPIV